MSENPYPSTVDDQPRLPVEREFGNWRSGPLQGFILAVIGGSIAWFVIEATSPVFLIPKEYHLEELGPPPEEVFAHYAAQAKAIRQNAMLDMTWVGAFVAGMLALGESIRRGCIKPALLALPIGAVAGCAAGFVGSFARSALNVDELPSLFETVVLQIAMLGTLGAGIGLALGLSTKSWVKVLVSGLFAGILAGVLYPAAVSVLLPTTATDTLIPNGATNRIVWIWISVGLLGLITTMTCQSERPRNDPVKSEQVT